MKMNYQEMINEAARELQWFRGEDRNIENAGNELFKLLQNGYANKEVMLFFKNKKNRPQAAAKVLAQTNDYYPEIVK